MWLSTVAPTSIYAAATNNTTILRTKAIKTRLVPPTSAQGGLKLVLYIEKYFLEILSEGFPAKMQA